MEDYKEKENTGEKVEMRIIVCSNIAGAGKDVTCAYLVEKYGFTQYAFADPIREIAYKYFGMTTKDRGLLQKIGEKMREINSNVWVDYTFKRANESEKTAISDLRRKNEINTAFMHGYFPVRIVAKRELAIERIIKRDGHCDISLLDNESETGTRELPMYEITNNGDFEDLHRKIDKLVEVVQHLHRLKYGD